VAAEEGCEAGRRASPLTRLRIGQEHVVAALYVAGMFTTIMDSTVVNTALPAIARQFGQPVTAADWVVIGYLLSLAVATPASGWLGDRFGTRRVFLAGLALFTVVSAACGLAPGLGPLIGLRVLQGAGGGLLAPVGQAMLFRTFPPERRARAAAVLMVPTVVAPAAGPVIGGLLVTSLSWRWIFYINVPIGVLALLFGLLFLRERSEKTEGRFDALGFFLALVGFGLLLYTVSEGPVVGWGQPSVWAGGVLAAVALGLFVRTELRIRMPMLSLRLLENRLFGRANLVQVFGSGAFGAILFLMPQFLQEARGASALSSGLTTFPEAVGVILSSRLVARLYPRVGPRRLMAAGLTAVSVTMALLLTVNTETSPWIVRLLMFFVGAGMAYQILPLQAAAMAGIGSSEMGHASALFNTIRQVAWAMGVAITGTVVAALAGPVLGKAHAALVGPYHAAFLLAAAMAATAALLALGVRDADAAATMVRARPQVESPTLEA
jgi:EmrB/QacA subfamily drug resistance transporter